MKPSDLTQAIETYVLARRPAMVWSQPGMGKSSIFAQTADRLGMDLYDVRMSGRDPVDLMGLPRIEAVKKEDTPRGGYGLYPEDCDYLTKWAQPSMLPRKGKRPSILFLDEINRGTQMVLNVCLQLVQDRRIGDYVLPDDCVVMAAGNPESDPGVIKMSSAMKERFQHVHLEIDTDDWCSWALSAGIDPIVIAFIRFRPELLHRFDPKELKSPNPRNWQFVSEIIAVDPAPHIEHEMFVGALGKAAAIEFSAFRRLYKSLPNIDAILLNPETARVAAEPNVLYATAAALSRRITVDNFGRALKYLDRMPREYSVLAVKMASAKPTAKFVENAQSITTTPEYTAWCVKNVDVF